MMRKKIFCAVFLVLSFLLLANESELKTEKLSSSFNLDEKLFPALNLNYEYTENGVFVFYAMGVDTASFLFRQYNEKHKANSFGSLQKGEKLFCPYGSTACFWLEYENGIKSRAIVFYANEKDYKIQKSKKLFEVLSPKYGTWKLEQALTVNMANDTNVYYSLDGSDPEKFGQIYFKPFIIEKKGSVNVKLKAVSKKGKTQESDISYIVGKRGKENDPNFYFFNTNAKSGEVEKPQAYNILAWNYLEFILQSPLFYEISKEDKIPKSKDELYKKYTKPIFIDRNEDIYIFWTCESFDDGKVQKIFLPKKPTISFSENSFVTNNDFTISFSDPRYVYTFSCGNFFIPFSPTYSSHRFDGTQKTFTLNTNEEFDYSVRIKAFYDAKSQGEFFCDFKIDKKNPPNIQPLFSTESFISSEPVLMQVPAVSDTSDYATVIKISPEAKKIDERTFLLFGESGNKTDYHIVVYNEDNAKNKSEVFQKVISITPQSIYVDSTVSRGTGTKENPFSNIEVAFNFIRDNKKDNEFWTIYLKGNHILSEPILTKEKIKIIGSNASITLKTNVGFVLQNADLTFENIFFSREEVTDEPRNVPIIYSDNSKLNLHNVNFETKNDGSSIRTFNTKAFFQDVHFKTEQEKYTECFIISNSELIMQNITFEIFCNSAVGLVLNKSICQLIDSSFTVETKTVTRALELKDSNLSITNFIATRLPDFYNNDTCIYLDKKSTINKTNVTLNGFRYEQN